MASILAYMEAPGIYYYHVIYNIRPQGHSLDHIRDMSFHVVNEMPRLVIIKI